MAELGFGPRKYMRACFKTTFNFVLGYIWVTSVVSFQVNSEGTQAYVSMNQNMGS